MTEKRKLIPAAALARRLGIVGTTGSGKTYTAKGAIERKLSNREKVVIIDPLDVWWGLRMMADGKSASPFELVIFGGKHADMPISENGGKLLGEAIATAKESCIVSLGALKTEAARRRFMVAFLDALYEHTDPERSEPYTIVFDEADMWAPQKPFGGNAEMILHLVDEIVRRGRVRGFLPWLISQRPAIVNKNVLSQVDGMVAMQLTGAHDRNAIGAWIEGHADPKETKELLASLAGLQQGHGLLWVPRDGILEKMWFPENATFDSSRTPKRGEKKRDIKLKPLNLDRLKGQLASVEAEAKINDPTALKKKVAELELQLRKVKTPAPVASKAATGPRREDVAAIKVLRKQLEEAMKFIVKIDASNFFAAGAEAIDKAAIEKVIAQATASATQIIERKLDDRNKQINAMRLAAQRVISQVKTLLEQDITVQLDVRHNEPFTVNPQPLVTRQRPLEPKVIGDGTLTSVMRETLGGLAWWAAIAGNHAPTSKQLAGILGLVAGGSTMRSRLAQLIAAGLITYPEPGKIALTDAGAAEAPQPDMASTLVETIRQQLTAVERETFDAIPGPGEEISREDLAVALGKDGVPLQPGGSTMRSRLANLTKRDIIAYPRPGAVTRQEWVSG